MINYVPSLLAVAPNITTSPEDTVVLTSTNSIFTCIAIGIPRPNITWVYLLDGDQIVFSPDNYSIKVAIGTGDFQIMSTLTLDNTQPFMSGVYGCNASNEVGSELDVANLTIYSKYSIQNLLLVFYLPVVMCSCSSNNFSS